MDSFLESRKRRLIRVEFLIKRNLVSHRYHYSDNTTDNLNLYKWKLSIGTNSKESARDFTLSGDFPEDTIIGKTNFELVTATDRRKIANVQFDNLYRSWKSDCLCKSDVFDHDNILSLDKIVISFEIEMFLHLTEEEQIEMRKRVEEKVFNRKYSDITLVLKDVEFRVHKNILSEKCPFFDAMFHSDMKEKNTDSVEIQGIEPEVMKEMLIFIYMDRVLSHKYALELFVAADQYGVSELTTLCKDHIIERLSMEDIQRTLEVSEMVNDKGLKDAVLKFISRHRFNSELAEIIKSEKWSEMLTKYPGLNTAVMLALIEKESIFNT